jgi:ribonuclease J
VAEPVRVAFLGGLGEIGRNCACVEVQGRILLLDCGLMFPDSDMPGVDLVLPDFAYLLENADRVEACVLTHGHEDHTGGLAYLLRDLSFPVYGSALTLGLARSRIEEAGLLERARMVEVSDGERLAIGPFDVELVPVTHSVPQGFAVVLRTPQGVILHSGDFKLDLTPVDGRRTDLARIGAVASGEGVRLLLSDSTNAEEPGFTLSESTIGTVLRDIFHAHPRKRIVATCFASHIHRVQQVADAAMACGRRIATLGRSMGRNVSLARELGLLRIPDHFLVDIEDIGKLAPQEVCVVSTGSQGEPLSGLALMAAGENKWIEIGEDDVVVLSANAIPGNEWAVSRVIDGLCRLGAEVVHPGVSDVHVSGHARQGELMTLLSVVRPEHFVPVHGEYRHLSSHARLAARSGLDPDKIHLCEDGDVLTLSDEGVGVSGEVPAGYLYVDGIMGDVTHGVLRDRRVLSEEGVVVVVAVVDSRSGAPAAAPQIVSRGWTHPPEAGELLEEAAASVSSSLAEAAEQGRPEPDVLRSLVRSAVGRVVSGRTRRRPMIVPVVVEA